MWSHSWRNQLVVFWMCSSAGLRLEDDGKSLCVRMHWHCWSVLEQDTESTLSVLGSSCREEKHHSHILCRCAGMLEGRFLGIFGAWKDLHMFNIHQQRMRRESVCWHQKELSCMLCTCPEREDKGNHLDCRVCPQTTSYSVCHRLIFIQKCKGAVFLWNSSQLQLHPPSHSSPKGAFGSASVCMRASVCARVCMPVWGLLSRKWCDLNAFQREKGIESLYTAEALRLGQN